MLVLSTPTYGKQDAPKFRASDLIPNFAAYTGRAQRTEQQIEDMVTSLLNHGQEQAFLFRKGFQDQAIPVTGHTRILAADRITKRRLRGTAGGAVEVQFGPETPFLLMGTYRQMNEFEALIHTFTENDPDSRTPLNDMDYAFLIRTMNESFGVPYAEIATKLKKPASWVSTHRTLLNLEPEIQDKVRTGEMPFSHAQAIAKVAPEDRSTVLTKMATEGGKVTAERITQTAVAVGAKRKGSTTLSMSAFRKMVKGIADGPSGPAKDRALALWDVLGGRSTDLRKALEADSFFDMSAAGMLGQQEEEEADYRLDAILNLEPMKNSYPTWLDFVNACQGHNLEADRQMHGVYDQNGDFVGPFRVSSGGEVIFKDERK